MCHTLRERLLACQLGSSEACSCGALQRCESRQTRCVRFAAFTSLGGGQVDNVFGSCAQRLNGKLSVMAESGQSFDIEANFSQLTLDVIGMSLFNYDFDALNKESPVIQAVYDSLKETEMRATVRPP